jgi:hypothetical protein
VLSNFDLAPGAFEFREERAEILPSDADPERLDLYNSSKAREAVEKNGKTLDFPAVANRAADWLYSKRMSI